jgi:integrase
LAIVLDPVVGDEQVGGLIRISPLRPHDLRHSFAFSLAEATGSDAYELERRRDHF